MSGEVEPRANLNHRDSPYKGLAPYAESDAGFFFGRESEWEVVSDNLMATKLTLLYGASGVGKSSLLRAGVVHHLQQKAKENLESYGAPEFAVVIFSAWQDNPLPGLKKQIETVVKGLFNDENIVPLPTSLRFDDFLRRWAARLDEDGGGGEIFIILDQFEEYFLYHPNESGEETFFTEFSHAINCPRLPANFLISIREDSLAKLDRFKTNISNLFNNYLRIKHLSIKSAHDAILKPVEVYNRDLSPGEPIFLDEGLVEFVVDQVSQVSKGGDGLGLPEQSKVELAKQVEAPYLQLVMEYVWRQEIAHNHSDSLKLQTLLDLGGAEEIVGNHLTNQMKLLRQEEGEEALVAVAKIFQYLVTPSGSKVAYPLHDLVELTEWPELKLRGLLEKLASGEQRILRPASSPSDSYLERYEIFHDVLAQPILNWRERYLIDAEKSRRNLAIKEGLPAQALRQQKFMQFEKSILLACQAYRFYQRERNKVLYQIDEALRDGLSAPYFSNILRSYDDGLWGFIAVAFNPKDPEMLASTDRDGIVRLWDLRHSEEACHPEVLQHHHQGGRALAFSPDGKLLAFSGPKHVIYLWSKANGAASAQAIGQHDDRVNSLAFSADGTMLASGSRDCTIKLWRLQPLSTEPVAVLTGHSEEIRSIAFSPSANKGYLLASASRDSTVKLWDVRSQACLETLDEHRDLVRSVAFSPDGKMLASGSEDKTVILWDVSDPNHAQRLDTLRNARSGVRSVAFSPDGRWFASGSEDQRLYLWRLYSSLPERDRPKSAARGHRPNRALKLERELMGHSYSVNALSFSPDSRLLASGSWDKTIRLWHLYPPEAKPQVLIKHDDNVLSVAVSPDGEWLVSGSWDQTVRLRPLKQPDTAPEVIGEHEHRVLAIAFAPNSRMLASASRDRTIKLWRDVHDRSQPPVVLKGHTDSVSTVAFSADGRWLASGSWGEDGSVRLWDLQSVYSRSATAITGTTITSRVLWQHKNSATDAFESIMSVAFSPDGRMLASGGNGGTIKLLHLDSLAKRSWEAIYARLPQNASGAAAYLQPRTLIGHKAGVWCVAFSPDNRMLASGSDDKTVRLWALGPLREEPAAPTVLEEHNFWVGSVAFSPNGRMLASGSYDKTIRLWNLDYPSEDPILLRGHEQSVTSVAFTPDGERLLSASYDNTVLSWIVSTDTLAEIACEKVQRNLTKREWDWFMGSHIPYEKTCPRLPAGKNIPEERAPAEAISDLEREFQGRLNQLFPQQRYFLKFIEQLTMSQPDVSEERLAQLLNKPKADESIYYRLETLRLLGFLTMTDPGHGPGTIRYGLSPQYREYLDLVA